MKILITTQLEKSEMINFNKGNYLEVLKNKENYFRFALQ